VTKDSMLTLAFEILLILKFTQNTKTLV